MSWRKFPILASLVLIQFTSSVITSNGQGTQLQPGTSRLWITAIERGHPIKDLKAEDLRLQVSGKEQPINSLTFSSTEPLRVGLLIDSSGSRGQVQWPGPELAAASAFFDRVIGPGDQAFVIGFNEKLLIDTDLTNDLPALDRGLAQVAALGPRGRTALYDAIEAACEHHETGGPSHRVLVLITDGLDNSSSHSVSQAMTAVRMTSVLLYVIEPIRSESFKDDSVRDATAQLTRMARTTGGLFFVAFDTSRMASAFNSIAAILRAQYVLEFTLSAGQSRKNGTRIKIRCSRPGVEIIAPEEL